MLSIFQDLRFAVRVLAKAPGFACAIIITLGVEIGATSAIFSIAKCWLVTFQPGRRHSLTR